VLVVAMEWQVLLATHDSSRHWNVTLATYRGMLATYEPPFRVAVVALRVASRVAVTSRDREPVARCTQRTHTYRQVDACPQLSEGASGFSQSLAQTQLPSDSRTAWRVWVRCRFGVIPPMPSLSILSISTASAADACQPLQHPVR
jgi:hypothetical protein